MLTESNRDQCVVCGHGLDVYNVARCSITLFALALLLVARAAFAQQPDRPHRLIVDADAPSVTINKHVYGHFAEHLGRDIYGGFWIRDDEDGETVTVELPPISVVALELE